MNPAENLSYPAPAANVYDFKIWNKNINGQSDYNHLLKTSTVSYQYVIMYESSQF